MGNTGYEFQVVRSCPSPAEAPSSSTGAILPLVDFGQVNHEAIAVTSRNGTHGAMTSNGLWTTDSITMLNSAGKVLAQPGPVYGGRAFQDTWRAAS
jgi:hypothetical protein